MSFADLNLQIAGIPKLRSKLSQLNATMKERVHHALAFEGEEVKTTAQSLCPVRTGYLRSTIYARIEDWTLKVGASAHYAAYVEFGTRFMKARRFLRRAVEFRLQGLVDAVNRGVGDAIREVSS